MLYNNNGDKMKIKSIKKQANKYKIILEDNTIITTYDDIIIKNNILYKKELDEDLIKKIEQENNYYEAYNKIIKYIKTKLRSEFEIKKYMNKLEINESDKIKILEKLKIAKLIDDKFYAKAYIHDRISLSNEGPYKIKESLLKECIDENIINQELETLDKNEIKQKLKKLILKKLKTNHKYSENMFKQKILNYFINLGYDRNEIIEIIDNEKIDDNEIIKKEYDKLYNKLKQKYNDYELNIKIKQKLYQKGFKIEEINKILN